ncbi:transcriptional regulator, GntR family [Geodermatophilus pulveris]|uniref:Transcriptional regulator, GntR family n=1 Tax=Geodermatophilus pulveris TaxID=1564159 RepID=A0A239CG03_9ACTN|nr:GntR family transcriptional regulator [Geodermatophilus pulveris]SNS19107.1 transcriptional regulator, GntR family [Geodermatophilus pulveris]
MAAPSGADGVPGPDAGWLRAMADEVRAFDRSSTAERVADLLRRRVIEGDLPPGRRLSEEQLVDVLHVSRNTLREAFRLLTHEGLLVHRLHRGVFVPELDEEELVDLYRLRRTIECDVVRRLGRLDPVRLRPLHDDVAAAEDAARRGDWGAVGTANMRFHQHLVALAGSRRIDETAARLLAEVRLAFSAVGSPQRLHEPYVRRNRALLELLVDGESERAAKELEDYLQDSEAELLAALRDRAGERSGDRPRRTP